MNKVTFESVPDILVEYFGENMERHWDEIMEQCKKHKDIPVEQTIYMYATLNALVHLQKHPDMIALLKGD